MSRPGDARAKKRQEIKGSFRLGRRSVRYTRFTEPEAPAVEGRRTRGARPETTGIEQVRRPTFVPCPEGVDVLTRGGGRKP